MTWRFLPTLLTLLTLSSCSASDYGAIPASSSQPSVAALTGNPCVIKGQIYCWLNSAVVQATISQTICTRGWTKTIRPDVAYTNGLKRKQLAEFASLHQGDPEWTVSGTEEDHRLPLEIGGFPGGPNLDEHNLSPEVHRQSTLKDKDENAFRHRVCSGEPLRQAQAEFVNRYLGVYPAYK